MTTPADVTQEKIRPGVTIGGGEDAVVVECEIGRGGMGKVFKAWQESLARHVAVKTLSNSADNQSAQRFSLEGKAAATLSHPNVVEVYRCGEHEGERYIIMELVVGEPLARLLERQGKLEIDQFYAIFSQLLRALCVVHERGFVHRDIKPSNIIVTADGITKLMDFGIAKAVGPQSVQKLTQTGAMLGSPWYMSPEQCAGAAADARSDIYSVACTMYHALCGKPPFTGDSAVEVLMQHLNEQADTLRTVAGEQLSALVSKAMAKNPDDRFLTSDSFLSALERCQSGTYDGVSNKSARKTSASNNAAKMRTFILLSLAMLLVAGVGAFAYYQSRTSQEFKPESDALAASAIGYRLDEAVNEAAEKSKSVPPAQRLPYFAEPLRQLDRTLRAAEQSHDRKAQLDTYFRIAHIYMLCDDAPMTLTLARKCMNLAEEVFPGSPGISDRMLYYSNVLSRLDSVHPFDKQAFEEIATRAEKQLLPLTDNDALRHAYAQIRGQRAISAEAHGDTPSLIAYGTESMNLYKNSEPQPSFKQLDMRARVARGLAKLRRWKEVAPLVDETLNLIPQCVTAEERPTDTEGTSLSLAHTGLQAAAVLGNRAEYERCWTILREGAEKGKIPQDLWESLNVQRADHMAHFGKWEAPR